MTGRVRNSRPRGATTRGEDRPSENDCGAAVRLTFGAFTFDTGGDLTGIPDPGQASWRDPETPIGRAIGATDVRVMNHHGSISPDNAAFLPATHSRVLIIPAWAPTHPAPDAVKRALTPTAYPGPRDVFITSLREPTAITIGESLEAVEIDARARRGPRRHLGRDLPRRGSRRRVGGPEGSLGLRAYDAMRESR